MGATKEALSLMKMAIVILFLAATIWVTLFGMYMARDMVGDAVDRTEGTLSKNTQYILKYLVGGEMDASVAEAYALLTYNSDLIVSYDCAICGGHGTSEEGCCLKNHLSGKCRIKISQDGTGRYVMNIYRPR